MQLQCSQIITDQASQFMAAAGSMPSRLYVSVRSGPQPVSDSPGKDGHGLLLLPHITTSTAHQLSPSHIFSSFRCLRVFPSEILPTFLLQAPGSFFGVKHRLVCRAGPSRHQSRSHIVVVSSRLSTPPARRHPPVPHAGHHARWQQRTCRVQLAIC